MPQLTSKVWSSCSEDLPSRLGFHIEQVQTGFPDCTARRRGKTCRIEFEYRASNYKRHPPRGADVIVCWDNDWSHCPPAYRHLEIVELKKYVGALPRVFAVGCDELVRGNVADKRTHFDWSVPVTAQVGDLIVMYRKAPASEVRDLWKITGPFYSDKTWGYQAYIKLVTRLPRPLTYSELKREPSTRNLGVVRKRFQGRTDITNDWPMLYASIIKRNPKAKACLQEYNID